MASASTTTETRYVEVGQGEIEYGEREDFGDQEGTEIEEIGESTEEQVDQALTTKKTSHISWYKFNPDCLLDV